MSVGKNAAVFTNELKIKGATYFGRKQLYRHTFGRQTI